MNYHSGYRFQKGRGIGSFFSGLMRFMKPIAMKGLNFGKKMITSDAAKQLGSSMLDIGKEAAKDVIVDVLEGKNFIDSSTEKLKDAKSKIAETLSQTIRGSGSGCVRNGKRKLKETKSNKKKKKVRYNLFEDEEDEDEENNGV